MTDKIEATLKIHKIETKFTAYEKINNISTSEKTKINLEKVGVYEISSQDWDQICFGLGLNWQEDR